MPVNRFTDTNGVEHVRAHAGGAFIADPRNLTRDAEALRMRAEEGLTYPEIAERIGLKSARGAQAAVKRAIDKRWPLAQEHADAMRAEENRKLDEAERKVWEVLDNPPIAYGVNSAKIVIDPRTGEPMIDTAKILSAVEKLVSISRRRSGMNGLDTAVESRASLRISTDIDREIGGYLASLSAAGRNDDIVLSLIETFRETTPGRLAGSPGPWTPGPPAEIEAGQG